jgi:hypothetical protein
MGFDEIFENSNKHSKYGNYNPYNHDDHNHTSEIRKEENNMPAMLLGRLRDNPKLKGYLVAAGLILIAVIVILIILLFPSIQKLFGFISENGIQGLINSIWTGNK